MAASGLLVFPANGREAPMKLISSQDLLLPGASRRSTAGLKRRVSDIRPLRHYTRSMLATGKGSLSRRQHRAVVIGGDQPLTVPLLENPGRVHLIRVRNLGLAAEQDAGFADDDRGVPADEAEAELLVVGRGVLERPLEGQGHVLADHVTAVAERAGHDGGRVPGVVGDHAVGVAGLPRLVGVNQYVLDGGLVCRMTV